MSHQTGIKGNAALLKAFGECKSNKTRIIKISIINEELALDGTHSVKKDWEHDYEKMIIPLAEDNIPCYILFRTDTKTSLGYDWLLLSWTPDTATIRLKMLYASTKATLKTEFGSANIKEEINATTKGELSLANYFKYKSDHSSPGPLTSREEEMLEVRRNECNTNIHVDTRQQTLGGIQCPITEEASKAIREMVIRRYNYLQFKIELADESIHLEKASNIELKNLPELVPSDHARYHLYFHPYTYEGDFFEKFIFIYSMPGYVCTVKERMMYSSCKSTFINAITELGLNIDKKLEIDEGSELTEVFLQNELHPQKFLHRPQFAKPKGPMNRGAKRLTKVQD